MGIWGIVERLKEEGVSNIAKEGLTSEDGVSPFLFIPKRLQVLNPNADTTSKTFGYKRAV